MPKDSTRFLSSARSARQTRARPMPNFEQLHEKWGRLMENRKHSAYKPTVPVEFEFGKVEKSTVACRTPIKPDVKDQIARKHITTMNACGSDQESLQQAAIGAHGSDCQMPEVRNFCMPLTTSASIHKLPGRVPIRDASATKRACAQVGYFYCQSERVPVPNTDFVVDRIRSRLDEMNTTNLQTVRRTAGRVLTPRCTGNMQSVCRNPPASSAKKPAQRVPLMKPVTVPESDNRQLWKNVVVRTIQFDDSDDSIQLAKSDVSGSTPEPQAVEKNELKKPEKTDGHNVVGNIYCDQPTDHVVHSGSLWHDNVLSSGKAGGVRSPLSVIGRSPGSRKLVKGDLAAKKAALHGSDLASAKKAVAELIATVEMGNCKENACPHLQHSSDAKMMITTDKAACVNRIHAAGLQNIEDMKSVLDTASSVDEATEVEQGLVSKWKDEDVCDSDDENKENVFHDWSTDEIVEISDDFHVNKKVGDQVEQLDKQARTLRRRSQLSTDSSEYESILLQLKQVRQRQAELEQLQMKLRSRLLHYQSTSADEKPLNLKLNSSCEVECVDQDIVEPLDLRIVSLKQTRELTHENNERVILADITSKVVGNADPNDCFEVPDSPPAAATDADNSASMNDAAEVDGILPLGENLADHHTAHVETEEEFVEFGQKKLTPLRSSPTMADISESHAVVGVLDQYLASLNVSEISEADPSSPATANVASPDTSSEFSNYQAYQRPLDVSERCFDPISAVLLDGDDQHFRPISEGNVEPVDTR